MNYEKNTDSGTQITNPQELYMIALQQRADSRIDANAQLLDPLPEVSIDPKRVKKWEKKVRKLALKVNTYIGINPVEI